MHVSRMFVKVRLLYPRPNVAIRKQPITIAQWAESRRITLQLIWHCFPIEYLCQCVCRRLHQRHESVIKSFIMGNKFLEREGGREDGREGGRDGGREGCRCFSDACAYEERSFWVESSTFLFRPEFLVVGVPGLRMRPDQIVRHLERTAQWISYSRRMFSDPVTKPWSTEWFVEGYPELDLSKKNQEWSQFRSWKRTTSQRLFSFLCIAFVWNNYTWVLNVFCCYHRSQSLGLDTWLLLQGL